MDFPSLPTTPPAAQFVYFGRASSTLMTEARALRIPSANNFRKLALSPFGRGNVVLGGVTAMVFLGVWQGEKQRGTLVGFIVFIMPSAHLSSPSRGDP